MELCREVSISFKAVAKEVRKLIIARSMKLCQRQDILFAGLVAKFTDIIAELEAENSRLTCEVNKLKNIAAVESTLKRGAEEAANQLIAILHIAELENQYLKRDIQKRATVVEDFRVSNADSYQIVNEASVVLEKLKSLLPSICM